MPQTPISATAQYNSTTPTTLYTVPAGRTAVVKSILSQSVIGGYNDITINKVSGGVTSPIVVNAATGYAQQTATNYWVPSVQSLNLLSGPITLGAGDAISISTSTTPQYKFPAAVTATTNPGQRISNIEYLSSGHYVAVGLDNITGYGLVLTSTDGITWTQQTFNFFTTLHDIAYDGSSTYVAVGLGGSIYYSTNLTSWTANAISANSLFDVTYGNSRWVAVGSSGQIAHATTASGAWTLVNPATGFSTGINSVRAIGTNFVFATSGPYFYSNSTVTSFTFPFNGKWTAPTPTDIYTGAYALGASRFVFANANSPNTLPTTALFTSTDYGKTSSAVDLSALSNRPANAVFPHAMNNGGFIAWMGYHPGNSRYLASSDGATWTSQNFTGTDNADSTWWYSANLYGQPNAQGNSIISWLENSNKLQIGSVSSSGIYATQLSFLSDNSYLAPSNYSFALTSGHGNSAGWIMASYNPGNTQYFNAWYGNSATNGSNTQYIGSWFYVPSYGAPYSMTYRPNGSGFLVGAGRYIVASTTLTNTVNDQRYDFGSGVGSVVGIAAGAANSSTSRIIAVTSAGRTAYSLTQGENWSAGGTIPSSSFGGSNYYMGTGCLTTNGTYWIAMDTSFNFFYTTDAITWYGSPVNAQSIYNLNSLNIWLHSTGVTYSSGTSVDTFTYAFSTTSSFNSYPSIRRMGFANGTYVIGNANTILTSTNLLNWTSRSIGATQINADTFISTTAGSSTATVSYAGGGSPFPFVIGSAVRTPSADNCNIGKPTPLATALNVGFSTAGIVEIS